MATVKSVTVLTPNGRRQNVKVNPNTTIIQILEEVCQKHEFSPEDYDLKHYNRILDVNLIFRYSNIPNNGSLEMVPCKSQRITSNVTICLQLENGERKVGDFTPATNLETILQKLLLDFNSEKLVIIYMQREIFGMDQFKSTSLKSLGLVSGKALFRLIERDPESSKEQAHVYVPSTPKIPKIAEDNCKSKSQLSMKPKTFDPINAIKSEKKSFNTIENLNAMQYESIKQDIKQNDPEPVTSKSEEELVPMEIEEVVPTPSDSNIINQNKDIESKENLNEEIEEPHIEYLGERSALLFNKAAANFICKDEIPDEFFDLTLKDAQFLLRDAIQNRQKLEESPLQINAQRELEKNVDKLSLINKYKQAIIRIHFPSKLVLQGLFGPFEPVNMIKCFIKNYLENPEDDFILYTTPPRKDLDGNVSIIDHGLVPSAIIYFSGSSDLKPEIKSKLSDPAAVNFQTTKTRLNTIRNNSSGEKISNSDLGASTSKSESKSDGNMKKNKIPKWFKK